MNDDNSKSTAFIEAKTRTGQQKRFETHGLIDEFGFATGDRVRTPKGDAWVLGRNAGNLYFCIDGDTGASKWTDCGKQEFKRRGFRLLYSPFRHKKDPGENKKQRSPAFADIVNKEEFSDVTFKLDDGSLMYAYKGILSASCEYFKALFMRGNFAESSSNEIEIHKVTPEVFRGVLEFLYTGVFTLPENDVEKCVELLQAADLFLIHNLRDQIASDLIQHITEDNAFRLLNLASERHLTRLKQRCKTFIQQHIRSPVLQRHYLDFSPANPELCLELFLESAKKESKGSSRKRKAGET